MRYLDEPSSGSPSGQQRHPLPTVAEILELPELLAGEPELVAGFGGEGREARWAHVVAGASAAELLDGGELVLTTGAGWPSEPDALEQFAKGLTMVGGVGVAAIILELGSTMKTAPTQLVLACDAGGVPLIVLHREVRFVQITQRVHQRILAAQTEALEARDAVHSMLTELGLNRSPVDYVVEQLSTTLDAPVVLEDSAHRVVAFAERGDRPERQLAPWAVDGSPLLPRSAVRVPVEARGTRWGYLTALPGPSHPAGRRTVLELGAFALALGRLADAGGDQWLQATSKRVFESLLQGRYRNDVELETQLAAAGLPLAGRAVLAVSLHGMGEFASHISLEHAILETALRRAVAPEGRVLISEDGGERQGGQRQPGVSPSGSHLLALISLPQDDVRAQSASHSGAPELATRLAHELDMLVPEQTPAGWHAHLALGPSENRLRAIVGSLEQLRATGVIEPSSQVGRVTVQQAERRPLAHLIGSLSGTPELQAFTSDMLNPLIEHDRGQGPGHSGDLLQTLNAYTAHPTNRSLAAKQAQLSRSVFYQRLELIEELLGVDLADGEAIAALHVALLAHRA